MTYITIYYLQRDPHDLQEYLGYRNETNRIIIMDHGLALCVPSAKRRDITNVAWHGKTWGKEGVNFSGKHFLTEVKFAVTCYNVTFTFSDAAVSVTAHDDNRNGKRAAHNAMRCGARK
jgi:hypothetical protein